MKLASHYRTLGLRHSASFSDVKKAYRQLVRNCHPDINPDEAAIERFIQINAAYTAICDALQKADSPGKGIGQARAQKTGQQASHNHGTKQPPERLNLRDLKKTLEKLGLGNFQQGTEPTKTDSAQAQTPPETTVASPADSPANPSAATDAPSDIGSSAADVPPDVAEDVELKQDAYKQLRALLRQQKFPRAIALVEGLAHRLPTDTEINQWQAIVYQRWGRQLISQGQFHKAHLYLKKALQTDPNNPSLSDEVARDLGLLKHIQAAEATLSQP